MGEVILDGLAAVATVARRLLMSAVFLKNENPAPFRAGFFVPFKEAFWQKILQTPKDLWFSLQF